MVGLPEDARTLEYLDWVAGQVDDAAGDAMILRAQTVTRRDRGGLGPADRIRVRGRGGRLVRWATRAGVHIDRASSAWLIRRFIDAEATFQFVTDLEDVEEGAVPFDIRGVEFGHHGQDCTFETLLRRHDLLDPTLWRIASIVHEADLEDDRYDAPEAPGLDVVLRGLSLTQDDDTALALTGPVFDGLYDYYRRSLLLGTETPS